MPVGEAQQIEQRAKSSGLSVNSYARSLLNRERVDSAVAIALLHKLLEAQHTESLAIMDEQKRQIAELSERFDKLKSVLQQMIERAAK